MRLILVWAIATMLPTASESTAITSIICCQSAAMAPSPSTSKRIAIAKAASLGAAPISKVTEVGEP